MVCKIKIYYQFEAILLICVVIFTSQFLLTCFVSRVSIFILLCYKGKINPINLCTQQICQPSLKIFPDRFRLQFHYFLGKNWLQLGSAALQMVILANNERNWLFYNLKTPCSTESKRLYTLCIHCSMNGTMWVCWWCYERISFFFKASLKVLALSDFFAKFVFATNTSTTDFSRKHWHT